MQPRAWCGVLSSGSADAAARPSDPQSPHRYYLEAFPKLKQPLRFPLPLQKGLSRNIVGRHEKGSLIVDGRSACSAMLRHAAEGCWASHHQLNCILHCHDPYDPRIVQYGLPFLFLKKCILVPRSFPKLRSPGKSIAVRPHPSPPPPNCSESLLKPSAIYHI